MAFYIELEKHQVENEIRKISAYFGKEQQVRSWKSWRMNMTNLFNQLKQ